MNNRNSGIWEGKFLERGKYKNVENENKPFTISDFEIGKSMKINTFSFHICDTDLHIIWIWEKIIFNFIKMRYYIIYIFINILKVFINVILFIDIFSLKI